MKVRGSVFALLVIFHSTAFAAVEAQNPKIALDWVRRPSGDDMARNYPAQAATKGLEGRAVMKCTLIDNGQLDNCSILSEWPKDMGFGPATLKLRSLFKMTPAAKGAEITIPIAWRLRPPITPKPTVKVDIVPWVSTPSKDDIIAAFASTDPDAPGVRDLSLQCLVDNAGFLRGCKVSSAQPGRIGLEDAVLKLSQKFKADLDWRTAISWDVDLQVTIPIQIASSQDAVWKISHIGKPAWIKTPDPDLIQSLFPPDAVKAKTFKGKASVDCLIAPGGALTKCQPQTENPENMGFGQAAAKIAEQFVMNPWTTTGLPAGGEHITLPLIIEGDPAATAPAPGAKP